MMKFFMINSRSNHFSFLRRKRKVLTESKFVIDDYKGKKGLFIEGKGKIWLRLAYDDDPDVAEIAIDRITIHDDEDTYRWGMSLYG